MIGCGSGGVLLVKACGQTSSSFIGQVRLFILETDIPDEHSAFCVPDKWYRQTGLYSTSGVLLKRRMLAISMSIFKRSGGGR